MSAEQLRLIAPGDKVRVSPSAPGRRDGFEGVVRSVEDDTVTVFGGKSGHESWRTVARERIAPRSRRRRG